MNDEELTREQARRVVESDRATRAEAAAKAIQAVLTEYECDLVAAPQITQDGRISAIVQLVAR